MRTITSYTRDEITNGLKKTADSQKERNAHIRVLFAPTSIDDNNFNQICSLYSRLDSANYETAVIVEAHEKTLAKKLPMASNRFFETPLGKVRVNDYLRNEFCDEDDDFFIYDEAFSQDMSLFHHLMMLQGLSDDIEAVSVQIADENHYIIKELAHVFEEVLASRNALLIFCCDLAGDRKKEFERVKEMLEDKSHSALLNYLNSGESRITGTAAFIAGIILAHRWGLELNFISEDTDQSLLTAYAERKRLVF